MVRSLGDIGMYRSNHGIGEAMAMLGREKRARAQLGGWLQGNWYRTGTSRSDVRHREYAAAMHDAGQVVCIARA